MKSRFAAAAVLFLAAMATSAVAQDQTIDDFTTGAYSSPGYRSGVYVASQNGTMVGGNRSTSIFICNPKIKNDCASRNPYNQISSYGFYPANAFRSAALVQTTGYDSGTRFEVGYGYGPAMDIDFSSTDRLRVTFAGLAQELNFNVQIFTGTSWGQNGCNLSPSTVPFTVELPYAGFAGPGFDPKNVNFIDFIFQTGSAIGGDSLAISSFHAVNGGQAGAIVCKLN